MLSDFKKLTNQLKLQTEYSDKISKALKEIEIDNKKLREQFESEKKARIALESELGEKNRKHQDEIKALMVQVAQLKQINIAEEQKVNRLEKELVVRDKQLKETDQNLKNADELFKKKLKDQEMTYNSKLAQIKQIYIDTKENEKILIGSPLKKLLVGSSLD